MTAELEQLTQADRMLAEIVTAEDARVTADFAGAAAVWAKKAGLGLSAANNAKAIEIKALMRMADLVDEGQRNGQIVANGRPETVAGATVSTIKDIGTTRSTVERARAVRDHVREPEAVDEIAQEMTQAGAELTLSGLVSKANQLAAGETPDQKDEWYTPAWVFDLLGVTFDLDVCAPVDPDKRRVPAAQVYTAEDDGLAQPWHGLIWCNPPYSAPSPWIDKWAAHPDGLILTHASVRAKRTLDLWNAADGIVMFSKMYFTRPSGADEDINLLLQIAARGDRAVAALRKVATVGRYAGPLWVPA